MTHDDAVEIDSHISLPIKQISTDASDDYDDPRDEFFEPCRITTGPNAKAVLKAALCLMQDYEKSNGLRNRARKTADQRTFERTTEAILADLMLAQLVQPGRMLAIPFTKGVLQAASRYRPVTLNKTLPKVARLMEAVGLLKLEVGYRREGNRRNQRSLIWAGQTLIDLMTKHKVQPNDLARHETGECIILKGSKDSYWDVAKYEDYGDSDLTARLRQEVTEVNEWIARAQLDVVTSDLTIPRLVQADQRYLRRCFTRGSFQSGGRLFGGWWMSLSKQDRLRAIRINGERVVGLDYGQMAPRVLYGLSGAPVSAEDLYSIPGIDPRYREGIKKLMNAMIFADTPLTRKPKETKDLLPKQKVGKLTSAVLKAHPLIAHLFHKGIGHQTQFYESTVMMRVLLTLKFLNIVALPIHDGVLVPQSAASTAKSVMEYAVQQVAGVIIPVKQEV